MPCVLFLLQKHYKDELEMPLKGATSGLEIRPITEETAANTDTEGLSGHVIPVGPGLTLKLQMRWF
jgi:hypothetical protein